MPKSAPAIKRKAAWIFVLNNPTLQDYIYLEKEFPKEKQVRYVVAQMEFGDLDTEHIQAYIQLTQSQRMSWLKSRFPRAHLEPAEGTPQQNHHYALKPWPDCECKDCKKGRLHRQGTWVMESGLMCSKKGERSDIQRVMSMVDEEKAELEIAEAAPDTWMKYYKGIERYRMLKEKTYRRGKPRITLFLGPSGSGKTGRAEEAAIETGEPFYKWSPSQGKWFDGYDGERVIILDEMCKGMMQYTRLLALLGGRMERVENKGGSRVFRGERFFITATKKPHEWYDRSDVSELVRRFNDFSETITLSK